MNKLLNEILPNRIEDNEGNDQHPKNMQSKLSLGQPEMIAGFGQGPMPVYTATDATPAPNPFP